MRKSIRIPDFITPGQSIAMLAPASHTERGLVQSAVEKIKRSGYDVKLFGTPWTTDFGTYAGTQAMRLESLCDAWTDPEVGAIICTRGGYGCIHLLPEFAKVVEKCNPKWLVGFSDVSALHAALLSHDIVSIHGSMAKYIGEEEHTLPALLNILSGSDTSLKVSGSAIEGMPDLQGEGILAGGNLAVASHLTGTPYDPFVNPKDKIFYIEDVGEAVYATERMLWQLYLTGALGSCKGLIVGAFTQSRGFTDFPDTTTMIRHWLKKWGIAEKIPVLFTDEIGHIPSNRPLINGLNIKLSSSHGSAEACQTFT